MTADTLSILLIGDSHVAGYQAQKREVEVGSPQAPVLALLQPLFVGAAYTALDMVVGFPDGRKGLNPLIEKVTAKWPGLDIKGRPQKAGMKIQKHLVLSWGTGLNPYDPAFDFQDRAVERFLFRHDIDFVLPAEPHLPLDPTCTILPVALIREMYAAILEPMKQALAMLAPKYPGRMWVVGSPPPSQSNAAKQRILTDRAKLFAADVPLLPSPTVALKTWLLVRKLVKSLCHEAGCGFIDCSPIACEPTGFLQPKFEHDGIHANAHYNDLMGQYMISMITAAELKLP